MGETFSVNYETLYPHKDLLLEGFDLILLRLSSSFHIVSTIRDLYDLYEHYYDSRIDINVLNIMMGLVNELPISNPGEVTFDMDKQYLFPDTRHAYLIIDKINLFVLNMYRKEVLKLID